MKTTDNNITIIPAVIAMIGITAALIFYVLPQSSDDRIHYVNDEDDSLISEYLLRTGVLNYEVEDTMQAKTSNRIIVEVRHLTETEIDDAVKNIPFYKDKIIIEDKITTEDKFPDQKEKAISEGKKVLIEVSSYAEAHLKDPQDKFIVEPLFTHRTKVIDTAQVKTWEWNVTPKTKGKYPLVINLSSKVYDGVEHNFEEIKVFEREIYIQANIPEATKGFLGKNWQWFAGTLLIPFLLYVRNSYLKRRDRKSKPPQKPISF